VISSAIPVFHVIRYSFSFLGRNLVVITGCIWLAALVGGLIFYAAIMIYLAELQTYLRVPSDANASIVLAVAGVAALLLLFVYSAALAAVTGLALGQHNGVSLLRIGHREYRLYAALLRFALVALTLLVVVFVFYAMLRSWMIEFHPLAGLLILLTMLALSLRLGFLLPAVAVATPQGVVLRRCWDLSRGNFWRLAAVAAILLLPGLVLELVGEWLGRLAGIFPRIDGVYNLEGHIKLFFLVGPAFAILISLAALLTLVLQAAASVAVYRALTAASE
jgi:hypothetical protein